MARNQSNTASNNANERAVDQDLRENEEKMPSTENSKNDKRDVASNRIETRNRRRNLTIKDNETVPVVNLTNGRYVHRSITSGFPIDYEWPEQLSVLELPFAEIKYMAGSRPDTFKKYLMVDDDEVVEYFNLKDIYENINIAINVDSILGSSENKMKETLSKLPKFAYKMIFDRARKVLDSLTIGKKSIIEEVIGYNLSTGLPKKVLNIATNEETNFEFRG